MRQMVKQFFFKKIAEVGQRSLHRDDESDWIRTFLDIYFGCSPIRPHDPVLIVCYGLFDLVLYPNALYFTLIVLFFFLILLGILVISLLNQFGVTNIEIDFDDFAGNRRHRRVGLTEEEMAKLSSVDYRTTKKNLESVLHDHELEQKTK